MNTVRLLNEKFRPEMWNQAQGWNDDALVHFFFSYLGCNTWIEGSFYLFKYEVCVVREWNEIAGECRGLIVYRNMALNTWDISSLPLAKFFNRNENQSGYLEKKVFDAHCSQFSLTEKADGTCIQLWFCEPTQIEENYNLCLSKKEEKKADDQHNIEIINALNVEEFNEENQSFLEKREHTFQRKLIRQKVRGKNLNQARLPIHIKGWRASTLGRITPSVEMEELFWNLFSSSVAPEKHDDLVSLLDKNYTYIFELCGKQNKVVTIYEFDKLYLIAARHISLDPYTLTQLSSLSDGLRNFGANVHRPLTYSLKELKINDLSECERWIEEESKKIEIYGKHPEGFVLYLDSKPVAKMKNKSYHNIHQLNTGNILFLRNMAMAAFFNDTIDDIYGSLQEPVQRYVIELKAKFLVFLEKLIIFAEELKRRVDECIKIEEANETYSEKIKWSIFSTQTNLYKSELQKNENMNFSSYFFSIKLDLMKGGEYRDETVKWIKKNYTFFDKHWKQSEISEIILAEKIQEKVYLEDKK